MLAGEIEPISGHLNLYILISSDSCMQQARKKPNVSQKLKQLWICIFLYQYLSRQNWTLWWLIISLSMAFILKFREKEHGKTQASTATTASVLLCRAGWATTEYTDRGYITDIFYMEELTERSLWSLVFTFSIGFFPPSHKASQTIFQFAQNFYPANT